jgi:hypothetical protein
MSGAAALAACSTVLMPQGAPAGCWLSIDGVHTLSAASAAAEPPGGQGEGGGGGGGGPA